MAGGSKELYITVDAGKEADENIQGGRVINDKITTHVK
jgi:hypothetical protein